jgi:hypothetical protein
MIPMPLAPDKIDFMAKAIGGLLHGPLVEQAFLDATGSGLYDEFAGRDSPLNQAIVDALTKLNKDGRVRWLLTYVLIDAVAIDELRRLIVGNYPEALTPAPSFAAQVDRVLAALTAVMNAVLKPEIKPRLETAGPKLAGISRKIDVFLAYKNFHAILHGLHLKLTVRPAFGPSADPKLRLDDLNDWYKQVNAVYAGVSATATALTDKYPDLRGAAEFDWIPRLQLLLAKWKPALDVSNVETGSTFLTAVQRLVPLQLSDLNARIFEAAKTLSLSDLISSVPLDVISSLPPDIRNSFIEFEFSVRDLKPSVLARVFEHKIWQDVDDGLSGLDQLLSTEGGVAKFRNQWVELRLLAFWLATFYPTAPWPGEAKKYSDNIQEQLANKSYEQEGNAVTVDVANPEIRPSYEGYRRLLRYQFLEIDTKFKQDCSSLLKFGPQLQTFVDGIGNG